VDANLWQAARLVGDISGTPEPLEPQDEDDPTVHSTLLVIAHSTFCRHCGKSDRRIGAAGKRVGYAGRGAQIIQLWAFEVPHGSRTGIQ